MRALMDGKTLLSLTRATRNTLQFESHPLAGARLLALAIQLRLLSPEIISI